MKEIIKLKIKLMVYKNPIIFSVWRFCYVKIGSIFYTIYVLFKFNFNLNQIDTHLNIKRKDVKYDLDKIDQKNIRLTKESKESRNKNEKN